MLRLYVLLLEGFKSSSKNFEIRIRTTNTSLPVLGHLSTKWTQISFCPVPDECIFIFSQYWMNADLDQHQMNADFFPVPNEHRASPTVPNECRFLPSTRWMQTFSHSTGWTQIFSHSTGWTQTLSHSTRWTQSFFPQYRMNVEANIVCSTGWTQFCSTKIKQHRNKILQYQNRMVPKFWKWLSNPNTEHVDLPSPTEVAKEYEGLINHFSPMLKSLHVLMQQWSSKFQNWWYYSLDQAFHEVPPCFISLSSLLNNLIYNINFLAYVSHFLPMAK